MYYNNSGTEIQANDQLGKIRFREAHADESITDYNFFCVSERELVFYVNKAPRITVRDILNEIAKVLNNEKKPPGTLSGRNIRLVEVSSHRIAQIIDEETSSELIMNNNTANRK